MGSIKETESGGVSEEKMVKAIVQFIEESAATGTPVPDAWLTGERTTITEGDMGARQDAFWIQRRQGQPEQILEKTSG